MTNGGGPHQCDNGIALGTTLRDLCLEAWRGSNKLEGLWMIREILRNRAKPQTDGTNRI